MPGKIPNNKTIQTALLFALLFSACTPGGKTTGVYWSSRSAHVITLHENGEYSYAYKNQFIYAGSSGTWIQKGKQIMLHSFYQDKLLNRQIRVSENGRENQEAVLRVTTIPLPQTSMYYYWLLKIQDSIYAKRPVDSACFTLNKKLLLQAPFSLQMVTSNNFPSRFFDTLTTKPIVLQQQPGDTITIQVAYNDSLFNYRVFTQEVITRKRGKLRFDNQVLTRHP